MDEKQSLSLAEAATGFLASLPPEQRRESELALSRFVRWFGGDRPISELGAQETANFAEAAVVSTNPLKRIEPIRQFLSYARKAKLTRNNLAVHLRLSKTSPRKKARSRPSITPIALTVQGHADLKAELEARKEELPHLAEEIRHAAADKDFRENAPLQAARDQKAQVEGRIQELEAILSDTMVLDTGPAAGGEAYIGCTVTLCDLDGEEEFRYTLVSPSEANPSDGKLSVASPIGKALLGHGTGDVVVVEAPVGMLHYRINNIER
ncbi:GreA/GreB family elongation factor [Chloroflexota bacterium]